MGAQVWGATEGWSGRLLGLLPSQALNPGLLNKEWESYLDSDVTFSSLFEQQEDVNSVLRQTFLGNGYNPHSPQIPRYPGLPLLSLRACFLPGSPNPASVTERGALSRLSGIPL